MAKNVQINGVDYANVASVKLPLTADLGTLHFSMTPIRATRERATSSTAKKAWVDGSEVTGTIAAKTSSDLTCQRQDRDRSRGALRIGRLKGGR